MFELRTLGTLDLRRLDGGAVLAILAQPKRLALLVYLALARPRGFQRRDSLVALFWPELDAPRARNALSQALHRLRGALGEESILSRGQEEVGLDRGRVRCDAIAFEEALEAGDLAEALELYGGELLNGFHVGEAPGFERWLDGERARLRHRATEAAEALAENAEQSGDAPRAAAYLRRALAIAPTEETALRRLIELLDGNGERAAAVREYEAFAQRLREESDVEPSPETLALVEAVRAREAVGDPHGKRVSPEPREQRDPETPPVAGPAPTIPPAGAATAPGPKRLSGRILVSALLVVSLLAAAVVAKNSLLDTGAKPALGERARIVLADFAHDGPDGAMSALVTEAMRIDLGESPRVALVTPEAIAGALRRMGREPGTPLDPDLAREVAVRVGAKAVIAGDIQQAGSAYVLSVRLSRAADGELLVGGRQTAADSTEVIAAIDRLSGHLRERIGEPLSRIAAEPPLPEVTTASLEALRKYAAGVRANRAGQSQLAMTLFEEAISLDTLFAGAYLGLAGVLRMSDERLDRRVVALSRAYELRGRLTERERVIAEGAYYFSVSGELGKAVSVYESWVASQPEDLDMLDQLAVMYLYLGDTARVEPAMERLLELDPLSAGRYRNLMIVKVILGKLEEANSILARMARNLPDHPEYLGRAASLSVVERHYDHALHHAEALRNRHGGDLRRRVEADDLLAALHRMRGRFNTAERYVRDAMWVSEERGRPAEYLERAIVLAHMDLWRGRSRHRSLARVDSALAEHPIGEMKPLDVPWLELAGLYARAGQPRPARYYLTQYEAVVDPHLPQRDPRGLYQNAQADVLRSEGRYDEAVAVLRRYYDAVGCTICVIERLAAAYDAAGTPDSAIAIYERYVDLPWMGRQFVDSWSLGPAYERLATHYEGLGAREKALLYYGRLIDLWRDADQELRARVEAARRAVD